MPPELHALLHAINNHLTVAIGYAELLDHDVTLTPAAQARVAAIVEATVAAAATLTEVQMVLPQLLAPAPV